MKTKKLYITIAGKTGEGKTSLATVLGCFLKGLNITQNVIINDLDGGDEVSFPKAIQNLLAQPLDIEINTKQIQSKTFNSQDLMLEMVTGDFR